MYDESYEYQYFVIDNVSSSTFYRIWGNVSWRLGIHLEHLRIFKIIRSFGSFHKVLYGRKCTHMLCHCLSLGSHWPLVKFLVNKGPLFKEFEKPHYDVIHQVKLKLNHLTTIFCGKGCWCNLFFEHKHLSIVHWLSFQKHTFVFLFFFSFIQSWNCTLNATAFAFLFNVFKRWR